MIRRRKIKEASIPTASMADIAFNLLLFFLVATTFDIDTGIGLTLPEYLPPEKIPQIDVQKDRIATLSINEKGDIIFNDRYIEIEEISNNLKPLITGKIDVPSNKKLIVSIKTDRKTVYNKYISVLDQVKKAYFIVREEYSLANYGQKYKDLDTDSQKIIKDKIPIIISLAEPGTN
jgi:biopolymer transport protein ExbD